MGFGVPHLKQLNFDANTLLLQLGHAQSPARTFSPSPGFGVPHLKHAILLANTCGIVAWRQMRR